MAIPKRISHFSKEKRQRDVTVGFTETPVAPSSKTPHSAATGTGQDAAAVSNPYRVTEATIKDIQGYHRSQLCEYDYVVQDSWIEGTIPKELVGTYLKNGPGMQTAGRHTFDGDGMIVSFSFDGTGRVRFMNKFVRTRGFLDEQAAGHPIYRTAFTRGAADGSPLFNPLDLQLKNVANTGVLYWGEKLLALYESNLPYELDPTSLNTFGETRLGNQLQTPVLAGHYRILPGQQQLQQQQQQQQATTNQVNTSAGNSNGNASSANQASSTKNSSSNRTKQQWQQPKQLDGTIRDGRTLVGFAFNATFVGGAEVIFYEFAEDGKLCAAPKHYPLPGLTVAFIHDIVVTPDYYVIMVNPVDFSMPKFLSKYLTSRCSIAECIEYRPEIKPTQLHLVPRPGGAAVGTLPYVMDAPAMFNFHHVNAYQVPSSSSGDGSGDGSSNSSCKQLLVLDTVGWDTVDFQENQHNLTTDYYKGGSRPQLQRLVFELDPPKPPSSAINGRTRGNHYSTGHCLGQHLLARRTAEFPGINWDWHGQVHRHIYACADTVDDAVHWGPVQSVLKVSVEPATAGTEPSVQTQLWDAGRHRFVCEPLFVARPNGSAEDDGWVLAITHNCRTGCGELVILDAQHITDGPLATIKLPHHLPAGLHGSFTPELLLENWPADGESWRHPNVVRAI